MLNLWSLRIIKNNDFEYTQKNPGVLRLSLNERRKYQKAHFSFFIQDLEKVLNNSCQLWLNVVGTLGYTRFFVFKNC
jgi:hypothetical protein